MVDRRLDYSAHHVKRLSLSVLSQGMDGEAEAGGEHRITRLLASVLKKAQTNTRRSPHYSPLPLHLPYKLVTLFLSLCCCCRCAFPKYGAISHSSHLSPLFHLRHLDPLAPPHHPPSSRPITEAVYRYPRSTQSLRRRPHFTVSLTSIATGSSQIHISHHQRNHPAIDLAL